MGKVLNFLFGRRNGRSGGTEKQREIITDEFLNRVAEEGALAEACNRLAANPRGDLEPLPQMSTWALICEEIVDTEYDKEYYERVICELHRRDFTDDQIKRMRVFAWKTAGWLNFEKMVWDWCSLDEKDILKAIEWQEEEGEITSEQRKEFEEFLHKHGNSTTSGDSGLR